MNILEEFWYGNLDPGEYDANPSKEYKQLVRLISRNEEKLLATMTAEQKVLFSRFGWQNDAGSDEGQCRG